MTVRFRPCLLALLSLLTPIVHGTAGAATRVTNVAQASWTTSGRTQTADSNEIVLVVEQEKGVSIDTFTPDDASPSGSTSPNSICRGSGVQSGSGNSSTGRETIVQTRQVLAGDDLIFTLNYPGGDADPAKADTMIAVLTTKSGDRETLTVYETGVSTGKFTGRIATAATPPAPRQEDCLLSVLPGTADTVTIAYEREVGGPAVATTTVDVLADPFGRVFDSEDGGFVSGARVSFVDATTGAPARVFAPDGKTVWPSSVVTGQPVTDAAGVTYPGRPGRFQFPLASPGSYRLVVEPPAPYKAPSSATATDIALLSRPNGQPFAISDASYGKPFLLAGTVPLRIDIPVDAPQTLVELAKTASRTTAARGDVVLYTITVRNPDANRVRRELTVTDALPPEMRLRANSVKVSGNGQSYEAAIAADGRSLTVTLHRIPATATRTITYALDVRPDAKSGQAINRVTATDIKGNAVTASVSVRVTDETIASRMTIIGRVVDAPCTAKPPFARGIAGVRVMLEDGSYSVTDRDGRYHFEGVTLGSHVVQIDRAGSPDWSFVDCARSTRSAGSATSRFVDGQGGTLATADFHAIRAAAAGTDTAPAATNAAPATDQVTYDANGAASDREVAGGERDWFKNGSASIAWLFPEVDHNPRSPALRVAIQHLPRQTVRLRANGKPVDPISFDGAREDPTKSFAVSLWRGISLTEGATVLTADVVDESGRVVSTLERTVRFTTAAARAEYLPAQSKLIADGVHRPVIAVRITDRNGAPVHQGVTGSVVLPAPYEAAAQIDAEQARILSGTERAAPTWRIAGDDGIAYIELAPTSTSGALTLDFTFRDREQVRRQKIETWLAPGDRSWTVVGLADGRIGAHGLGDKVEPLADPISDLSVDGRLALYAKGRVLGRWLLTLAYDSDKKRNEQRLQGQIDPNTYYTVYADRTERRFDAASTRKLYLKLEREQFYALFGDFVTGFNDTELGRYNRAGTGVKAEARVGQVAGSAFAARFATAHRREEFQGNGLSGPFQLSSRRILANSERIVIEVRDRLRSEKIIERKSLTRFVDYDLDYEAGTIRFSAPVLSRSSALDPQFIVADYELYEATGAEVSAGGRGAWSSKNGRVRIGATALSDSDETGRTNVGATDVRVRLGDAVEVRAEAALSERDGRTNGAYLVEAEVHTGRIDALAYARQQDQSFGVAQQNAAERGRRKTGLDGRVRLTEALSVSGNAWIDDDLTGTSQRRAVRARVEYRAGTINLRLGVAHANDRTDADASATSTLIEAGATRSFFGNRLELDLATSFAVGSTQSVDFPAQHRVGARYQITPDVTLTGAYEIANGENVDARTARIGFDVKPWTGARVTSSLGNQAIQEYGRRAFAAYGLAQSFQLSAAWSVDATLDGNKTLHGIDPSRVLNPAHPVASGGFVGGGQLITEDFTAVTVGGTYRADLWSATARAERRWADSESRTGVTAGAIRQLGDGRVLGALASWTHAENALGSKTGTIDVAISGASRPSASQLAVFGKVEYRQDEINGAVAGHAGPFGGVPLSIAGDALSRRLVGSMSVDWAPYGHDDEGLYQRHEIGLFVGTRYVFDRLDQQDIEGLSTMLGLDVRLGLGERLELGVTGTVRGDLGRGAFGYAVGPSLGFRPARNLLVSGGYNIRGFNDRDFSTARTTRQGPYVSAKLKFDENSLSFLGLGQK